MPPATHSLVLRKIFVRDPQGKAAEYESQLQHLGLSAEVSIVGNSHLPKDELRARSYDLVLWRMSPDEGELALLRDFLRDVSSKTPLLAIASRESRGSALESHLLEMIGNGVRDFCFDDEPAVRNRAIRRILAEDRQCDQNKNGADLMHTPEALGALVEACPLTVVATIPGLQATVPIRCESSHWH